MKYQNKKTGVIIDVNSEIKGGDWEEVKPSGPEPDKAPESKKKGVKAHE